MKKKEGRRPRPISIHMGEKNSEKELVYNKKFIPITKRLLEGLHYGLRNPMYVQKRNPIKERIVD